MRQLIGILILVLAASAAAQPDVVTASFRCNEGVAEVEIVFFLAPPTAIGAELGHLVAGRGDKPAYIDDAGATRYAALAERVNRFASALGTLGLEQEHRVMVAMLDGIDWRNPRWTWRPGAAG